MNRAKPKMVRCPDHDDRHPSRAIYPDGSFYCFACGVYGNGQRQTYRPPLAPSKSKSDTNPLSLPDPRPWANHPKAIAYFATRGLTEETVRRFSLGWDGWRFTIPCWRLADGKLMGIKRREDPANLADVGPRYISWPGSRAWLFNEAAMEKRDGLIQALEGKRLALGWTKAEMARALGIHWPTYQQLITYKLHPGAKLYHRILAAFPDLGPEIQAAIRDRR